MDICGYEESAHTCCCGTHSHREINMECDSNYGRGSLNHRQQEHCHSHCEQQESDKDFYEQKYHQLFLDKEQMERNYEKEKRERQSVEEKFQLESRERMLHEQRLSELNDKIGRYDNDFNLLRNENSFLKSQFDSLRNVINSRVNVESSFLDTPNVPVLQSEPCILSSENSESYRHEISILANENELFKQIIDIINNQREERPIPKASENFSFESSWMTDPDKTSLEGENSKLKNQIRELQKAQRDLQSQLEELTMDIEDKNRKMKNDVSHLEEKLHYKTICCQDLERQLLQVTSEYREEVQKMEIQIESEILKKSQIQEEVTALENTVHRLELERTEMIDKLDELYNSENEIIIARSELEARFTTEINELQGRLEEELRSKIDLSHEMTLLMNEFGDLRNKSNQMEEMYVNEIQALQINLNTAINGQAISGANILTNSGHQPNSNPVPHQTLTHGNEARQNDLQSLLNNEIQKRETLERENKDLLYKMKDILSNTDLTKDRQLNIIGIAENDNSRKNGGDSLLRRKIRSLENKVEELTDECETLRRSVRKRKDAENKNRELIDELEELSSERDGMLKKQKALVKEIDNSSSSLQDLSEKNRKLISEIDGASRKIREMEDAFRQERNNLINSFDREKSIEVNDYRRKVDDLEDRLRDQRKENKMLEIKIRKLEDESHTLKNKQSARDSDNSKYSSPCSSLTSSNRSDLEKKIEHLQEMLKVNEDRHLTDMEGQKKQLWDEFDKEKQVLKVMFEEEKCNLFANLNSPSLPFTSSSTQLVQNSSNVGNNVSGLGQQNFSSPHGPNVENAGSHAIPIMHHGLCQLPSVQGPNPSQSHNGFNQGDVHHNRNQIYPPVSLASNDQFAQLNETINELQQEIKRLNSDKQNMRKRLNNLEGQIGTKIDVSVTTEDRQQRGRSSLGQSRVHFDLDEIPERDVPKSSGGQNTRVDTSESYSSADDSCENLDSNLQDTMKMLVDEHREHSDELRKQIKLQKDSFEKERGALVSENKTLFASLKCLKKEIQVLNYEKQRLLQKLHKERQESTLREEKARDEVVFVKREYEHKVKQDSRKSTELVQELKHQVNIYEVKVKEMEIKFKDELNLLENRYALERNQLEIQIRESDNKVKSRMESHYQSKLTNEKEQYEKTLKELRKEIQCLQDQRKAIQSKLSEDASGVGRMPNQGGTFTPKSKNEDHYKRLRVEFENRYAQEKRSFENTIKELQKDVTELKKEKSKIKSSYKEERSEMEERFEREKRRIEERHRRDIDELKRSLDMFYTNDQMFLAMGGLTSNDDAKSHAFILPKKNSSLELKNDMLERDLAFLKGRVRDLESRQTKALNSNISSKHAFVMGDRKVRFELDGRSIPRPYSQTDLRSIDDNQHSRSSIKGLSRDDLEISKHRIGGTSRLEYRNDRSIDNYRDISRNNFWAKTPNSSGASGISHMASTGILNGVAGLTNAGARLSLSGGLAESGPVGCNAVLNSVKRSGMARSSGLQYGNGTRLGLGMISNRCWGSCTTASPLGLMAGYSNGTVALNGGEMSSGFLSANGPGLGSNPAGMKVQELNTALITGNQVGIGSDLAQMGEDSSLRPISSLRRSVSIGPGSEHISGNNIGLNSNFADSAMTVNTSGFSSTGISNERMNSDV